MSNGSGRRSSAAIIFATKTEPRTDFTIFWNVNKKVLSYRPFDIYYLQVCIQLRIKIISNRKFTLWERIFWIPSTRSCFYISGACRMWHFLSLLLNRVCIYYAIRKLKNLCRTIYLWRAHRVQCTPYCVWTKWIMHIPFCWCFYEIIFYSLCADKWQNWSATKYHHQSSALSYGILFVVVLLPNLSHWFVFRIDICIFCHTIDVIWFLSSIYWHFINLFQTAKHHYKCQYNFCIGDETKTNSSADTVSWVKCIVQLKKVNRIYFI